MKPLEFFESINKEDIVQAIKLEIEQKDIPEDIYEFRYMDLPYPCIQIRYEMVPVPNAVVIGKKFKYDMKSYYKGNPMERSSIIIDEIKRNLAQKEIWIEFIIPTVENSGLIKKSGSLEPVWGDQKWFIDFEPRFKSYKN